MSDETHYIRVACTECGAVDYLIMRGMPKELVENHCKLMDGTSNLYLNKPVHDPNSSIGKCLKCRAPFKAEVIDPKDLPEDVQKKAVLEVVGEVMESVPGIYKDRS